MSILEQAKLKIEEKKVKQEKAKLEEEEKIKRELEYHQRLVRVASQILEELNVLPFNVIIEKPHSWETYLKVFKNNKYLFSLVVHDVHYYNDDPEMRFDYYNKKITITTASYISSGYGILSIDSDEVGIRKMKEEIVKLFSDNPCWLP